MSKVKIKLRPKVEAKPSEIKEAEGEWIRFILKGVNIRIERIVIRRAE